MMLESGDSPVELRRKVASKGGTTQKALDHMDKSAVGQAIGQAVQAAFLRARELGS
jgi:pyrroline-5-carboxylate reductase